MALVHECLITNCFFFYCVAGSSQFMLLSNFFCRKKKLLIRLDTITNYNCEVLLNLTQRKYSSPLLSK